MNTPVNFKIATSLKEKGFDEYCFFIWNEENLEKPYHYGENYEMICQRIHYYEDIPMINNSYIEKYATYVEKDEITEEVYDLIAAPTIAEVVMWLYEKHNIWIYVDSHEFGKWCYNYKYNRQHKLSPRITENGQFGLEIVNLPTEAYEAAIEYTLNNLI